MTLDQELQLSYYSEIGCISREHGVLLVQDQRTGNVYVRKNMQVFSPGVYRWLQQHPVPGTPGIRELVEDGSTLIVIEDYISGDTLEQLLQKQGPLPEQQVLSILDQLCRTLQIFHSAEPAIVNRDLKPSNIKLTADGTVYLLDMNAARLCTADAPGDTVLLGTKGYAAPEQYGFGPSDPRADIYALGILTNVLLTGRFPREKKAQGKLLPIIEKCIRMDPAHRWQSISQLQSALSGSRRGLREDSWLPPGFRGKNPLMWIFSLLCYGSLISICMNLQTEMPVSSLPLYRVLSLLAILAMVFFSGNYRNVHRFFSMTRSSRRIVRLAGIVLGNFAIFFLLALALAILM